VLSPGRAAAAVTARDCVVEALRLYKRYVSPALPPSCRFWPTCSEYAMEAVSVHGIRGGGWLALRRVARCHPFHRGGIDPVPAPPAATGPRPV
jgi:hypothetical protein